MAQVENASVLLPVLAVEWAYISQKYNGLIHTENILAYTKLFSILFQKS